MYKVEKFEVSDKAILHSVMERHPFATVVTVNEGLPFINHLPITPVIDQQGCLRLLGHMSKRNPQWQQMKARALTVIAFQGPHAYVNPIWYKENDVPTWNYIVVHAQGVPVVIEDGDQIIEILKKTTEHMNRNHSDQWSFELPSDLSSKNEIEAAIVGFELQPEKIIGKFKLSQNRSPEDRNGVIEGLSNRPDEASHQVSKWMAVEKDFTTS